MGAKIILILFLVVVLGIVIYVFRSGIVGKADQSLETLIHSFPASSYGTKVAGPATYPSNSEITSGGQAGPATTATIPGTTTTINLSDIPTGFTVTQLSPYFHDVRFSGITAGAGRYSGSYGQISLSAQMMGSTTVDITGWQIKANNGGEYIPQAIDLYDPTGLTAPGDIRLQNGQYVYLYSSTGPFNVRINECIGYIASEIQVIPALPTNCPYPDRSAVSSFTGACQNFLNSIGSCQTPNLNSAPIAQNDVACRTYIENNFNYLSCFNAHEGDANFLSNQWWVWMGSSPVDQYHDTVKLLDKQGLLVDVYSY